MRRRSATGRRTIRVPVDPAVAAGCLLGLVIVATATAQWVPNDFEATDATVRNLAFGEAAGDSNSFHLQIPWYPQTTPDTIRVSENMDVVVAGISAQAGAAWYPPYDDASAGGKGRTTVVNWLVRFDGRVSGAGTLQRTGVPTEAEWYEWRDGEGTYPYGADALTNENLRMTFDLEFEAEGFDEGTDILTVRFWGHTHVWRNDWTPTAGNWRHTPTQWKKFDEQVTLGLLVTSERPYTVRKTPDWREVTRHHPASHTVQLIDRNDARWSLDGDLQHYETPVVEAVGPDGTVNPTGYPGGGSERPVQTTTHSHQAAHPGPEKVRVLPDFDPVGVDIIHRTWDVPRNQGREYRRSIRIEPTVLWCIGEGIPEDLPKAANDTVTAPAKGEPNTPKRGLSGGGAMPGPLPPPTGRSPFAGCLRVRIVSLALGLPTVELDATPDETDQWTCLDCVTSGDQVELHWEFRDPFGRLYAASQVLDVPAADDHAAPETLAIDQPILEPVGAEIAPEPALVVDGFVLDLAAGAFGVLRRLPGVAVADAHGAGDRVTGPDGGFQYVVPHGTVLELAVADAGGLYRPLALPATPPLETHLTRTPGDEGVRDDRLILWLTPSFAAGRLHPGAGRIDVRDGLLRSRVGAVSDIAPEELVEAAWETVDGQAVGPATVRPWGATPRPDLGYVPVLFALAPPVETGTADPAFQAALQAAVAAGGARLRVRTLDDAEHILDIPLETGSPSGAEGVPAAPAVTLRAAPNPLNPGTTLSFALAAAGRVQLDVYGIDGRHVATLLDGSLPAGAHEVTWQGRDDRGAEAASGLYVARLRTPGGEGSVKLVLLK